MTKFLPPCFEMYWPASISSMEKKIDGNTSNLDKCLDVQLNFQLRECSKVKN